MEEAAIEERVKQDVIEKYYYGFSSTELCEDFGDYAKDKIKKVLPVLEKTLEEQHGLKAKQFVDELHELWMEKLKEPLSKFQVESRKIFAIPSHVSTNRKKYSNEDIEKLRKEVEDLQTELIRHKIFLAKCKQENEIIENRIKPHCEKVNMLLKSRNSQTQEENLTTLLKPHEEQLKYLLKVDKFMTLEQKFV